MNKKHFYLFAMLAFIMNMSVMSSCSKDDDDEASIVGTWIKYEENVSHSQDTIGFVFEENHNCTWFLKRELSRGRGTSESYMYGTYKISGKSLTIQYLTEGMVLTDSRKMEGSTDRRDTYTYSISGNELSLTLQEEFKEGELLQVEDQPDVYVRQ